MSKRGTVTSAGGITYGPAYEQLERVRNLISNAEISPLSDVDEQAAALYHLTQLRQIYRRAHDEQERAR